MPTLTFKNTPFGTVEVEIEPVDEFVTALDLTATDADGYPVLAFGAYGGDSYTMLTRQDDWDSALPEWMQTTAMSNMMDRLANKPITEAVEWIRREGPLYDLDSPFGQGDFREELDYVVDGDRRVYKAVAKRLRIPFDSSDSTIAIVNRIIAQRRRANARSR